MFWIPRRTLVSDNLLEEAGVLGDLNVSEFPLYFLPLEEDLLSLELDESFADIYVRKDPSSIYLLARALMLLQQKHGLFPRIIGKGENAKKLADFLARLRLELVAGEDSNDVIKIGLSLSSSVESLIVIDREIDFVTPLLSQLTYKGMIDEAFRIQNNQIEVESSLLGTVPQSTSGTPIQSKQRKILLDSSDKLFDQLKDQNFATVGNLLNRVARRLQTDYESRHGTKTTAELREFVNKLPTYQTEQQNLNVHTNLAEEIMKHTQTDRFGKLLEVQQSLVTGADPSSQHDSIEELISRDMPLPDILRLLCLESCLSGGIKPRDLENFKKMILQAYGYQHILTFHALEKAQLLISRNSPMAMILPIGVANTSQVGNKTNYTYLRKALKLVVEEVDEHNPDDISYVYSGYAPLSVRIVQSILQKYHMTTTPLGENVKNQTSTTASNASQSWRTFGDDMKYVRGPSFDVTQKSEDWAVKARAMINVSSNKKVVFIVYLGGITFTEIAALRFMARESMYKNALKLNVSRQS